MDTARSAADWRRKAWLPWALLAGVGVAAVGGGVMGSRSVSALLERNAQLEEQALESEAQVEELQLLRASMERRLRVLEQSQLDAAAQREAEAKKAREAEAQLARREAARKTAEKKPKVALAKSGNRSGRR